MEMINIMGNIPKSEVEVQAQPMVVLVSMQEVLELLHHYPQWFRYNGLRNATGFIQGMKGVPVSPSLYNELMEGNK